MSLVVYLDEDYGSVEFWDLPRKNGWYLKMDGHLMILNDFHNDEGTRFFNFKLLLSENE